jgi:hypothetical protein
MERLFLFEEQFGSVPFHKQTQELALGTERFHFIPFGSRTEHTPKVQVFPHPYSLVLSSPVDCIFPLLTLLILLRMTMYARVWSMNSEAHALLLYSWA